MPGDSVGTYLLPQTPPWYEFNSFPYMGIERRKAKTNLMDLYPEYLAERGA